MLVMVTAVFAFLGLADTIVAAIWDGIAQSYFRGLKSCASQSAVSSAKNHQTVSCYGDKDTCSNIGNLCFTNYASSIIAGHDDAVFPYGYRSCFCTDGSKCNQFTLSSSNLSNKNGAYVNDCGTLLNKYSQELVASCAFNVILFVCSAALFAVCVMGLTSPPSEGKDIELVEVLSLIHI